MVDAKEALAAKSEIEARFGRYAQVKSIGVAQDDTGYYVVVMTTGQVPGVPLRSGSVRVRQARNREVDLVDAADLGTVDSDQHT